KTLSFWLIALLVPVMFFQYTTRGATQATAIDYSIYDAQLTADNIARVTIIGGREINGEFKSSVLIEGRESRRFATKLPVANSETEVERLRAKNVSIKAED